MGAGKSTQKGAPLKSTMQTQGKSVLYQVENQKALAENDQVRVMRVKDIDALKYVHPDSNS